MCVREKTVEVSERVVVGAGQEPINIEAQRYSCAGATRKKGKEKSTAVQNCLENNISEPLLFIYFRLFGIG